MAIVPARWVVSDPVETRRGRLGSKLRLTRAIAVFEMTNSASALGSEFDAFLFASVGWDKNEMTLSVVSALARLDVDPWAEAAKLARLPKSAAASRLAGLLADLPGGPPAHFDPRRGSVRLVALLPRESVAVSLAPQIVQTAIAVPKYHIAAFIVLAVVMFGAQYVVASYRLATSIERPGRVVADTDPVKTPTDSAP
jgi:hypothetical protein